MEQTLQAARAGQRELTRRMQVEVAENEQAVEEYQAAAGSVELAAVRSSCAEVGCLPLHAEATPFGTHVVIEPPESEDIADAWSWAAAHPQKSGLATRLDKYWKILHQPLAATGEEIEPADPGALCYKADICLCAGPCLGMHVRIKERTRS